MAASTKSDDWVWKHILKLYNSTVQCNVDSCNKTYSTKRKPDILIKTLKVHLYYKHKIWTEEDRLKWENNNDLIWQYYDKIDLYKGKCKLCKISFRDIYLKWHLRVKHSEEIRATIQKEIANKSLSQYFVIYEEQFNARCKNCNRSMDILYGTDVLTHHKCFKKDQHLISLIQEREDNNVNRMIQQSIAEENSDTNFHHIDRQTIGKPENQLR